VRFQSAKVTLEAVRSSYPKLVGTYCI